MGLFGFGKKGKDVIDLAERFRKQKEKEEKDSSKSNETETASPLAFFDSSSNSSEAESETIDLSGPDAKRKKFAKRILEITTKLEDISNQIYHLQQRIEVLERKADISPP